MVDFCAEHGIAAEIEVISADQINEAWERVLSSDVGYRFVITPFCKARQRASDERRGRE